VLSGSIYGGIADNKVTGFAGESSTGKTFFVLGIVKNFLDANPDGFVVYYDTEAAVTKDMMESRGIDTSRVVISEQETIQKFRHHAIKIIDSYVAKPEAKRPKMMMVLDSLGMLSTTKELEDSTEGKETRDMTKAQVIKAAFRVLTLKLARAKIPLIITNHVYAAVGCLTGESEVIMADGTEKQISDIRIGDQVSSLTGSKNVLQKYEYDVEELYEITTESGKTLRCTPEHKFLTENLEWKKAKDLNESDIILSVF
jgi:RecA/RadA recombinase